MSPLDSYSQRFAVVLFAAFPEWRSFAAVEGPTLVVKVPVPTPGPQDSEEDFLWIDTDGEITVGFDDYHIHFDRYSDVPEAQGFAEAIEFIQAIVQEEICVVTVMNGDTWCGSTTTEAGSEPDVSGFIRFDTMYIRSWKGTWNRTIAVAQKA